MLKALYSMLRGKTNFENERIFRFFGTEITLDQKMSSNVRVFGVSPGVLVMGCDFALCFW